MRKRLNSPVRLGSVLYGQGSSSLLGFCIHEMSAGVWKRISLLVLLLLVDVLAFSQTFTETLTLKESHLYGSSRLGLENRNELIASETFTSLGTTADREMIRSGRSLSLTPGLMGAAVRNLGLKQFEGANHLGNVVTTVGDRKLLVSLGSAYANADVASISDYYPFGSLMVGRVYGVGEYRYGFNGKEGDGEVSGEENKYDYGMRAYDGRLGRLLSVDPFDRKFPMLSTYQYASNNPIQYIDLDGLEGTKPVTPTQRSFLENVGIDVYSNARLRGYTIHGAGLVLALAATESGYGNASDYKKKSAVHNYFGLGGAKNIKRYASKTSHEGVVKGLDNLDKNFGTFVSLAKKEGALLKSLDDALNKGKLGVYNTDPGGDAYATLLNTNTLPGVVDRALTVVTDKINDIQGKLDSYYPEYVRIIKNIPEYLQPPKIKDDLRKITNLEAEKVKYESIKAELETLVPAPAKVENKK